MITLASAVDTHFTTGELLVAGVTLLLAAVTGFLAFVSERLVKVTTMAANAEMAKVAMNANDDMAEVSTAAITRSAPVGVVPHRPTVRKVRKHIIQKGH